MRICEKCNQEHEGRYRKLCKKCVVKNWLQKNQNRSCSTCQKKYTAMGINCPSCARKIRMEKRIGICCSNCNRNNVIIYRQGDRLCVTCWRKNKILKDPSYKEKLTNWQRKFDKTL